MTKQTRQASSAGIKIKISPDDINKTIDEAIHAFASEQFKVGIEALEELAHWYKSAGCNRKTFGELCQYIENEAAEESGSPFVLGERIRSAIRAHFKAKAEGRGKVIIPPASIPREALEHFKKKPEKK